MPARKKIWIAGLLSGLLILPLVVVLSHPRARAVLRLQPGFVQLDYDDRIYYEPGAEKLADQLAVALPDGILRVEKNQSRPLKPGFRIYVCATPHSFARRTGVAQNSPVRGFAFLRDVWISPRAFDFHGEDTHHQTLTHELSHLHLDQHLSWLHRMRTIPAWFSEGLADWVADSGDELVSRERALEGLVHGPRMAPKPAGELALDSAGLSDGLPWPMFHMQSRLFVEYLFDRNEPGFRNFVAAVVDGGEFSHAFEEHFGNPLDVIWSEFLGSLGGGTA